MNANLIRNEKQALLYLADCNLATVSYLASKKSRKKGEYERHIEIAQKSVNFLKQFNLDIEIDSRAYEVLSNEKQSVKQWAKKFEV
jgi:hypothetical protein